MAKRGGLRAQLARSGKQFAAIGAVAACHDCPIFGDLLWPPLPDGNYVQRLMEGKEEPGVSFESLRRRFVVHRIGAELRYYAGGYCPNDCPADRYLMEQERAYNEGHEVGVFHSVRDVVTFAKQYLVEERPLLGLSLRRQIIGRWPAEVFLV